jgi:hypothetical protein
MKKVEPSSEVVYQMYLDLEERVKKELPALDKRIAKLKLEALLAQNKNIH